MILINFLRKIFTIILLMGCLSFFIYVRLQLDITIDIPFKRFILGNYFSLIFGIVCFVVSLIMLIRYYYKPTRLSTLFFVKKFLNVIEAFKKEVDFLILTKSIMTFYDTQYQSLLKNPDCLFTYKIVFNYLPRLFVFSMFFILTNVIISIGYYHYL